MKHSRQFPERLIRTLVLTAVCSTAALVLAGPASASQQTNYGNFNPLTGRPYVTHHGTVNYGDFNPLTGRPDSAPLPSHPGSLGVPVATTPQPTAPAVRTMIEDHGGQLPTIILAVGAILIALASAGYTFVRTSTVASRFPVRRQPVRAAVAAPAQGRAPVQHPQGLLRTAGQHKSTGSE